MKPLVLLSLGTGIDAANTQVECRKLHKYTHTYTNTSTQVQIYKCTNKQIVVEAWHCEVLRCSAFWSAVQSITVHSKTCYHWKIPTLIVKYGALQCNLVQYSMLQCRCGSIYCNIVESTVQCSIDNGTTQVGRQELSG